MPSSKKFISLDLETTHLSPQEGRIMEVGAVEIELDFDEKQNRAAVNFLKKFESLVNPEIEVPTMALELTGITKAELDQAPAWSAVKDKLKKFIGESAILGHNINFDLEFLDAQGVKIKSDSADSLELALTFLPMLRSHSLEYLADAFGISSDTPHRALTDSRTSALLMAHIMNEFLMLPVSLQTEIKKILGGSKSSAAALIKDLPERKIEGIGIQGSLALDREDRDNKKTPPRGFAWENRVIYSFPVSFADYGGWTDEIGRENRHAIVALPHSVYLQSVPAKQLIPKAKFALCEKKFERILRWPGALPEVWKRLLVKFLIFRHYQNSVDLSLMRFDELERRSLAPVLVQSEVCRHHECPYAKLISAPEFPVRFADLSTFFELDEEWLKVDKGLSVLMMELGEIEEYFSEHHSNKWSLRQLRDILQTVFPLEKDKFSWLEELPEKINELAAEMDLFFGILHLVYMKREGEFAQNLIIDDDERNRERFTKLIHPAEKLLRKIHDTSEALKDFSELKEDFAAEQITELRSGLDSFAGGLKEIFHDPNPDFVYWLRFNADWVDLNKSKKNLGPDLQRLQEKYKSVSIVDTELPKISRDYFMRELGIAEYQKKDLPAPSRREKFIVEVARKEPTAEEVVAHLKNLDDSAVVVLPNENQLAKYFHQLAEEPIDGARVLAYKFSGSISRIRLKLAAANGQKTILLLTTNSLARYFSSLPWTGYLVILRLPFEAPFNLPIRFQSDGDASFMDVTLPRAVSVLHRILVRFAGAKKSKMDSSGPSRRIFLLDPRIEGNYSGKVMNYLQEVPEFELREFSTGK